jgi:hypothetical protein
MNSESRNRRRQRPRLRCSQRRRQILARLVDLAAARSAGVRRSSEWIDDLEEGEPSESAERE